MKVILNGEARDLASDLSIQQLLDQLAIPAGRVACEVNLKIIKRSFFGDTVLHEGDTVEIIQAIGGG